MAALGGMRGARPSPLQQAMGDSVVPAADPKGRRSYHFIKGFSDPTMSSSKVGKRDFAVPVLRMERRMRAPPSIAPAPALLPPAMQALKLGKGLKAPR
eukprot:TRINITY_DN25432_c0_g1_i1.p2 TRINITY_DN25432_c0_g1~~TRINITY_DN25432_c0_g1_i1.p2  ORF type:complete len:114 (+),score=42.73 TRINITY_DN25432_c0_g1_i1:49-342(+)